MCCFHVRLLSTRTPRNLAVVVCLIGTLAMEAEKAAMEAEKFETRNINILGLIPTLPIGFEVREVYGKAGIPPATGHRLLKRDPPAS